MQDTIRSLVDLVLVTDPNNHNSGFTIVSPSLSTQRIFGREDDQFLPSRSVHRFWLWSSAIILDPSWIFLCHVNGVTPVYEIPLPDSFPQYSTAFIAVTEEGNYAEVSIGPVMHDWENYPFVNVAISYQPVVGLPYAGRGRKR